MARRPTIDMGGLSTLGGNAMRDDIDLAGTVVDAEEEGIFDNAQGEYDDDIEYVKRVMNSEHMREVIERKKRTALARASRTPEEQEKHMQEVIEWAEKMAGREIPVVDYSRSARLEQIQLAQA
jgi:hypothetical protein